MKRTLFIFFVIFFSVFSAKTVFAVCPVCTLAIGTGVGLCRWLGISDLISGLWIGGLIISTAFWFLNWLDKKQIRFKLRKIIVLAVFYLIALAPLYFLGTIGHSQNKFLGIDKLIFGIISGSIVFLIGVSADKIIRSKNNGKAIFIFQKVVLPVLLLIIMSIIFYFTC
jgi:hypothetical protein